MACRTSSARPWAGDIALRTALVSPRLAEDVYPAALPGPDAGGVDAEDVGSGSRVVEVKDQIPVRIGGAGALRCAALDHQSLANLVRPPHRHPAADDVE